MHQRRLLRGSEMTRWVGGDSLFIKPKEVDMARGEQRSNREKKKPKKEKIKTIAAAPSQKGAAAGWQPNLASGKKK